MDRQLLNLCNRWEFDTYLYDNDDDDAAEFYDNDDAAAEFYDNDDAAYVDDDYIAAYVDDDYIAACDNSANETDKPLCASFCVIWDGLKW